MIRSFVFCLFYLLFNLGHSQDLTKIAELNKEINESSGILILENRVFTHNDSDQGPLIFEYDLDLKKIIRTIEVLGAENVDWEDISSDSSYVYIGDFGNNLGNRRDLKIYKISKADLLNPDTIEVESEQIAFSFKDQKSFYDSPYSSNFDVEAMICMGENIYLFSKNWSDFKTKLYRIPTALGEYTVDPIATFDVEGLISGAGINNSTSQIVLSGYDEESAFIIFLDKCDMAFNTCKLNKIPLYFEKGVSFQVEGIDFLDERSLIISSETGIFGQGHLFKISFGNN